MNNLKVLVGTTNPNKTPFVGVARIQVRMKGKKVDKVLSLSPKEDDTYPDAVFEFFDNLNDEKTNFTTIETMYEILGMIIKAHRQVALEDKEDAKD